MEKSEKNLGKNNTAYILMFMATIFLFISQAFIKNNP
jgi:hypothetical protein